MARTDLSKNDELTIYVPTSGRSLRIADGSAIVGITRFMGDEPHVEAYYEGAIYGQDMTYEDKLQIAAGRMVDRAPTTAFGVYPETDFTPVGVAAFSEQLQAWRVVEVTARETLEKWAGCPIEIGGSEPLRQRAAGLVYGRLSNDQRIRIAIQAKAGGDMVELLLAQHATR